MYSRWYQLFEGESALSGTDRLVHSKSQSALKGKPPQPELDPVQAVNFGAGTVKPILGVEARWVGEIIEMGEPKR